MHRHSGRARRWPAAAVAVAGVLLLAAPAAAWADTSPVPVDPGTTDPAGTVVVAAVPDARVHDDPACAGPESSTVTGDFSVAVSDLVGGPLAAVTVRSETLVVASAVAMLDDQGSGCAQLDAIPAGSYQVTASIGDLSVGTVVAVPDPVDPPATTDPGPAPVPEPDPTVAPPVDTEAPADPPPTDEGLAPDPGATSPAREAAPSPTDRPVVAPSPEVSTVAVEPAAARAADSGRPSRVRQDPGRATPSPTVVAQPVAPAPSPTSAASATVTRVLDSTQHVTRTVVSVLAADRPAAVTIIGFVVLEVVGVALLIAFVVLVVSRAPRRRD